MSDEKPKKQGRRKSFVYREILNRLDDIEQWSKDGLNESDIAKKFGITRQTFWKYKNENADIFNAIKKGRITLVDDLKNSLVRKAKGFSYKETKTVIRKENGRTVKVIEEYERYAQPDTGAIHLLLKNLDESWRQDDKTTVDMKREKMDLEKEKAERDNW